MPLVFWLNENNLLYFLFDYSRVTLKLYFYIISLAYHFGKYQALNNFSVLFYDL